MKNSITINFLLFTGFLVIGYSVSTRFYQSDYSDNSIAPGFTNAGYTNAIQTLNNGQRSILLIGVDSIETSKPKLESLWLVTFLPSDSTLHLLPIIPAGNDILSHDEGQIYKSFHLSRLFSIGKNRINLVPGQKFTRVLEENNFWWSGYLIYDRAGMNRILNLIGFDTNEDSSGLNQIIDELPIVADDSRNSFKSQLALFQSACQQVTNLSNNSDLSMIVNKISKNIDTNLDLLQVFLEWEESLSSGEGLNCEFPTMQLSPNNN